MPESTRITNVAIEVEGPTTDACIKFIAKWESNFPFSLTRVRQNSFKNGRVIRYRAAWMVDSE